MDNYPIGTTIKFTNGERYSVVISAEKDARKYICLATVEKPLKILFAEVTNGKIRVITDSKEKEDLLPLFGTSINE